MSEPVKTFTDLDKSKYAPKRNPAQKLLDEVEIERWFLKGKTCRDIARLLGEIRPYTVSHQLVFQDLKRIKAKWIKENKDLIQENIARELRGLTIQEDEAWEAYERSKLDRAVKVAETNNAGGEGKGKTRQRLTTESQNGDPRWMQIILEIRRQRRELLGLDAATRIELTGANGGPVDMTMTGMTILVNADELPKLKQIHEAKQNQIVEVATD